MTSLAIFGDSHAYVPNLENSHLAWPSKLLEKYPGDNYALYGTSLWYSFELFLENYHKYTHVVFVYTSASRIHCLPPHLVSYAFIKTKQPNSASWVDKSHLSEMEKLWATDKITINEKFDHYLYQKIFDDVNDICFQNNITLVNILPYENAGLDDLSTPLNLSKMTGSCITGIRFVTDNETVQPDKNNIDLRHCHLSNENNKILFDITYGLLNSKEQCIIHAKEIDKFVK